MIATEPLSEAAELLIQFQRCALPSKAADVPVNAATFPRPLRVADVVWLPQNRFEFDRDFCGDTTTATEALIFVEGCPCVDLVAFHPPTNRLATLCGRAIALGQRQIFQPDLMQRPLPLWRDPLRWLRFGRVGVVPINWRAFALSADHLPGVVAEDTEHATEVEQLLRYPTRPIPVYIISETIAA